MDPLTVAALLTAQALPETASPPAEPRPASPSLAPLGHGSPPPPRPVDGPRSASPRGNPGNWANSADYPSRALREEQEGVTQFRLVVGSDGRTTHCEIRESSGSSILDQTTCAVIYRRARFYPAQSATGMPIEGFWSSSVRWQIPGKQQPLLAAVATVDSFVVTADGGLIACGKGVVGFVRSASDQSCDPTLAYVPFRDDQGKPAARQVTITTIRSIADAH